MFKNTIYGAFMLAALSIMSGVALAGSDPTVHQVYETFQAGRLDEAQAMMQQVLRDHPESGQAHYVESYILAKEGRLDGAMAELDTAKRLSPGLPFAKQRDVAALETMIRRDEPARAKHGFPWGLTLLLIVAIGLIYFLFRGIASRNAPRYMPGPMSQPYPGGQPYPGQPYPGYGQPPMGGGMGSGILSGLATGAAVGAGMVAGEEIAHHFMDGNRAPVADNSWDNSPGTDADFGVADNSSWGDSVADNSDFGGGGDWS